MLMFRLDAVLAVNKHFQHYIIIKEMNKMLIETTKDFKTAKNVILKGGASKQLPLMLVSDLEQGPVTYTFDAKFAPTKE